MNDNATATATPSVASPVTEKLNSLRAELQAAEQALHAKEAALKQAEIEAETARRAELDALPAKYGCKNMQTFVDLLLNRQPGLHLVRQPRRAANKPERRGRARRMDDVERGQVIAKLQGANPNVREIAKVHDITPQTVYNIARAAKIKLPSERAA